MWSQADRVLYEVVGGLITERGVLADPERLAALDVLRLQPWVLNRRAAPVA